MGWSMQSAEHKSAHTTGATGSHFISGTVEHVYNYKSYARDDSKETDNIPFFFLSLCWVCSSGVRSEAVHLCLGICSLKCAFFRIYSLYTVAYRNKDKTTEAGGRVDATVCW